MTEHTRTDVTRAADSTTRTSPQQIADQVESFLLAVRAIARGEAAGGAGDLAAAARGQPGAARRRPARRADRLPAGRASTSPTPAPTPTSTSMRLRLAVLLESVDAYSRGLRPLRRPDRIVSSLLSDDLTSHRDRDLATACGTTAPAGSPRRCGGGSSPTSPSGATRPARCCARCSRWSPTTGSTPSSRPSSRGGGGRRDARRGRPAGLSLRPAAPAPRGVSAPGTPLRSARRLEARSSRRPSQEDQPWALSCRSTAAPPSPTPTASSGSPSGSSTTKRPATTSSWWSPRWATPPTS